ncbi:MAG: serine/threonine protein kinase [Myxococcaceae bacterium]|jgi:serine/threonine protein kinase|nr:serine/threonine protein kinase [Myxococcaceae bacterium]
MHEGAVVFGRYRVEKRLAVGGMGEVFLASHPGGRVVLKALLPALERQPEAVEQFLSEARLAARLRHPNIVRVLESGSFEGRHVLSMEYVDGLSVAELLELARRTKRVVPWAVAARIVADAAAGLAHAHAAVDDAGQPLGLVHRDVTPSNLLVGVDGHTRLIDFGIARAIDSEWRTATGVIKGKLSYVSPEQAGGAPATAASDQYALGLVLHELLEGARGLRAENDVLLLQKVLAGSVEALTRTDVPLGLEMVRQRMVALAPLARHASCGDVVTLLDAMAPEAARADVRALVEALRATDAQAAPAGARAPDAWTPLTEAATKPTPRPKTPASGGAGRPLARMEAWLAKLPAGLDSYPEATQKGSVVLAFLEGIDPVALEGRLPAPLAKLLKFRPAPSAWVSEVQATALYLGGAEACFTSDDAFVDFALQTNRKLLAGPLYGMLFRALGLRRVLQGATGRWEHLHRGSRLVMTELVDGRATMHLHTPANMVPPLLARCSATALHAALEVSGAKSVEVNVVVESDTTLRFEGTWR